MQVGDGVLALVVMSSGMDAIAYGSLGRHPDRIESMSKTSFNVTMTTLFRGASRVQSPVSSSPVTITMTNTQHHSPSQHQRIHGKRYKSSKSTISVVVVEVALPLLHHWASPSLTIDCAFGGECIQSLMRAPRSILFVIERQRSMFVQLDLEYSGPAVAGDVSLVSAVEENPAGSSSQ